MFGIGTPELLVILFIILLVFGSKKLPELARGLGKGINEFKRATQEIQSELDLPDSLNTQPKTKAEKKDGANPENTETKSE